MDNEDFYWLEKTGRDADSQSFHDWLYVHAFTGRIICAIVGPTCPDGYLYSLSVRVPFSAPELAAPMEFIGIAEAQAFAEHVIRKSQHTASLSRPEAQTQPQPEFNGAVY